MEVNVGSGLNLRARFTFPKIYKVEFVVINVCNYHHTIYFVAGNSTTARDIFVCNIKRPEQNTNKSLSVIFGKRYIVGKYTTFCENSSFCIKKIEVYGWEKIGTNKSVQESRPECFPFFLIKNIFKMIAALTH